MIFSDGLKVTNNFDFSLLIEAGALLVGIVCAKQIFPLSVWAVKLYQFLYFPVDLGVLALALKENKTNNKICGNYYRCCVPCSCDIMKYSEVQKMKYKFVDGLREFYVITI